MHTDDIAIIGGGLAGLHTAWRLERAGLPWRLFEARERLGGRIESARTPAGEPTGIDLGPSWFWPHQSRIQALLQALSLPWFEQYTRGAALFEQVPGQPPVRSAGAGAALSYRIRGGTAALVAALAGALDPGRVQTGQRLERAERDGERWTLTFATGDGNRLAHVDQLVLAVPPRLALPFLAPAGLSPGLTTALGSQQTWMSAQAKFVAAYPTPFWRASGLAGEAFSRVGPLVEIHDASPEPGERGALFGFIGVPAQQRRAVEEDVLVHHCLRQLERLFGPEAASPEFAALRDWSREPLTATAADIGEAPAHAHFPRERFGPELGALGLWPAGSEFAAGEPGYLEGALEASGGVANALIAKHSSPAGSAGQSR
jgi:monoamine oxidase